MIEAHFDSFTWILDITTSSSMMSLMFLESLIGKSHLLDLAKWLVGFLFDVSFIQMRYTLYNGIPMEQFSMKDGVNGMRDGDVLCQQIEIHEDRLYVSQRLLTSLFGPSADILYLMRMWEEEKPWLLNYQAGVED